MAGLVVRQVAWWSVALVAGALLGAAPAAGQQTVAEALRWRPVPAGPFVLGCSSGDADCFADERPARPAALERAIEVLETEVTVGQYRRHAVQGSVLPPPPPPFAQTDDHPVVNVTWSEAASFCERIGGRLPTELEWEYAARGGRPSSRFPNGDVLDLTQANFDGEGGRDLWAATAPVASFPPNGYGLFDIAGNVWEWCDAWYEGGADRGKPEGGGAAAPGVRLRVVRGGAWDGSPRSLRVSNRGRLAPALRLPTVGFRCVRDGPVADASGVPQRAASPVEQAAGPVPAPSGVSEPPPLVVDEPALVPVGSGPEAAPPHDAERRQPPVAAAAMVWLPAGEFEMGCVVGDADCDADEQPRRRVRLTRGLWLDTTEVTVGRYAAFAAAAGRALPVQPEWSGTDHPVVNVSWNNAEEYCRWAGGRLPTEAEWEFAARAGVAGERFPGGLPSGGAAVNGDGTGPADHWEKTAPVASFPANRLGFFDLFGNVWEWCADWYDPRAYSHGREADPVGPAAGRERVLRGGSWTSVAGRLRVSYRFRLAPEESSVGIGFRCARDGAR